MVSLARTGSGSTFPERIRIQDSQKMRIRIH